MIGGRPALLLLPICVLAALPARGEEPAEPVVEGEVWEDDAIWEDDEAGPWDPWEGMNRGIFAFNEAADRWAVEPLAIGWDTVVPEIAQIGVDNFFENVAMPRRIANDLLQGKPVKAGSDLGRFLMNTIFGIGGLFDPSTRNGFFPPSDEDFGQTLGVWGVPAGPYLVIPVLGPSSPRDALGLAVESFLMTPEYYFLPSYVSYISTGTRLLNDRALALETLRAERAAAFDFYAAARSAYVQYRENQVRDRAQTPEEDDEALYYLDEDDDADL